MSWSHRTDTAILLTGGPPRGVRVTATESRCRVLVGARVGGSVKRGWMSVWGDGQSQRRRWGRLPSSANVPDALEPDAGHRI